jgi:hypothetical protein
LCGGEERAFDHGTKEAIFFWKRQYFAIHTHTLHNYQRNKLHHNLNTSHKRKLSHFILLFSIDYTEEEEVEQSALAEALQPQQQNQYQQQMQMLASKAQSVLLQPTWPQGARAQQQQLLPHDLQPT